jgi:hypothetical protein
MPGPNRSKLKDHQQLIARERKKVPPTSYADIAAILKNEHGLVITPGSIWAFVKVRSGHGRKLKYVMTDEGEPAKDKPTVSPPEPQSPQLSDPEPDIPAKKQRSLTDPEPQNFKNLFPK